jgi:signal transduction histidine kinase
VNQELTEQNAALEIVRRDLELARTELEKRVAERTETLQLVNEQLSSAKDRAEHADGAKSEFLANMSHELRTPLNAIMGFSETIKEALFGPVDQRYREYASDIHRSGAHLLDVINDILDLSKLEAGKFELREERTSVDALISESMEMLEFRARNGGVALESAIAAQLPPLYADPLRMRQILINLLSNAVKFTLEGGKVTISARRHGDGGLLFEVSDTGIGMKPDDVSRALEPFRQIDSQLNRKHEGTGLGLPLVTRLAELHGGTFAIVSALGIGTTATVYMPPSRLVEPERSLAAG